MIPTASHPELSPDEIVARGQQLYNQSIRRIVESGHRNWYLVVNVITGEYEMDPDDLTAAKRAKSRFGAAPAFAIRIGHPTAYHLGGWTEANLG